MTVAWWCLSALTGVIREGQRARRFGEFRPALRWHDSAGGAWRMVRADGAALLVISLGRDEVAAEVRRDVHEQRRRRHRLVLDPDRVVDRLDG